ARPFPARTAQHDRPPRPRDDLNHLSLDLLAGPRDDVPLRPEGVDVLALRIARLLVLDEEVQRVSLVGDLRRAVRALAGPEQRRLRRAGRLRAALGGQRRPRFRARVRARALLRPVLLEEVERAALAVDEKGAELAVTRLHCRGAGRAAPWA